jgi:catechol 2,3-dioxygenase-like lactoylglutathione lyase family enzyme
MITGINHITLAVSNIAISFNFYCNVLGFKPLCKWNKGAYFLVGDDWFCLNVDNTESENKGCTHYAFTVNLEDFLTIKEQIIQHGTIIYKDNVSEGESLYFLDPDGHKLEIHVGNWQSRIENKRANIGSWTDIIWYI